MGRSICPGRSGPIGHPPVPCDSERPRFTGLCAYDRQERLITATPALQKNALYGILYRWHGRAKIVAKKVELTEQKANSAHLIFGQQNGNRKGRDLEKQRDLLAARLKEGDRAAAAELVDTYYEHIYLFMRRLGHDCQVSEDLTQESFLQAWQHVGQLREGKALNGWLYRIAGNVSKHYWRRHKTRKTISIEDAHVAGSSEAGDRAGDIEQLGQLKNAVARLPQKLRQVVVLHYMQNLTIAEAAEVVGVREGTFKSRLNRALRILRKQVGL